ncbi:MAG: hypothetical protein KGM24_12970 [Elusimicrobia bacterium]|nr:hypothetical protein [Elusimicrobiota bacterium]
MRTAALALLLLAAPAGAAGFKPHDGLDFHPSPESLLADCRGAIRRADSRLEEIAALPDSARTFDDTPAALDRAVFGLADETASDVFLARVAVSSSVRAASGRCADLVGAWDAGVYARADLARAVEAYATRAGPASGKSGEKARLLAAELRDFKREGAFLPDAARAKLARVRARLAELDASYAENLLGAGDALLPRERLAGLSGSEVAALEKVGDLYKVPTDGAGYERFMARASDPQARRLVEERRDGRAASLNVAILAETLSRRREEAEILGYRSYAAYALETAMAGDPAAVRTFLAALARRLRPDARRELKALLALKSAREGRAAGRALYSWDWSYYDALLKRTEFPTDEEGFSEYFPVGPTVRRALDKLGSLLGLVFREVPDADVWSPGTSLYEIDDASGGSALGYVYLDLERRPGKDPRAAAYALTTARERADGSRQVPVSAVLASLPPAADGRPTLLTRADLAALLRELGRALQQTLSRAKYGRFSGSNVPRDFVEAVPDAFAELAWDPGVLDALAGWYLDPAKKPSPELIQGLLAARGADAALAGLRQTAFAQIDQDYRAPSPPSRPARDFARRMRRTALIRLPDGADPEASFPQLTGGGAARYYDRLWSRACARRLFAALTASGPLDPDAGRRFRTELLENAGGRGPAAAMAAFLGAAPDARSLAKAFRP